MKVWQKKRVTFTIATFLSACLALPLPPEHGLEHDSASAIIPKKGKGDAESEDYMAEGFYSPANQTDPGNFIVIIQTWSDYLSGEPEGINNETTPQNTSEELPSRKQRSLMSTSEDYDDSDIYPEEGYETTLASDRVDEESKHFLISESNKYYIDQEEDYPQTHEDVEEKRGEELQEEPHETSEGEELTEESYETSEEEYNERRKRNVKNQESSALNTGISPNANDNSSSINQRLESSTAETITKMSEYKENAATTPESTNIASENENHDAAKSENKETTKMFLYKRSLDTNESEEDLSTKSTYEKHKATSKDSKTESYIKETSMSDSKGSIDTEPKEDLLTTTTFENKNKSSEENRTESVKERTRSEKLMSKRSIDEDASKEDDTTENASEETEGSIMDTATEVYNKETMKSISEFKRSIMNDESEKNVPTTILSGNMDEAVRDMTTEAYSKESTGKFMYKQSIDKDNSKSKDGNKMGTTTEVYNKETKPEKLVYRRNPDENYSKEDDTTRAASEITDKSAVETTTQVYNKLTMKSVSEFKQNIMDDESEKNVPTTIPYKNMDVTVMDITTEAYNMEATREKFAYKRSIDEYHAKDYTTTTASGVIDGTRMYTTAENLNKETMKSTFESKRNIMNDEAKEKTKV